MVPASRLTEPSIIVRRTRVVVQATRRIRLQPYSGGQIYGLLCQAYALGSEGEPGFPDGILIEEAEPGRADVRSEETWCFGLTWLGFSDAETRRELGILRRGLEAIGAAGVTNDAALGGNFELVGFEDLLEQRSLEPGEIPRALREDEVRAAERSIEGRRRVRLRFHGPVRMARPARAQVRGGGYFDGRHFDEDAFLRRLVGRLIGLGLEIEPFTENDARRAHLAGNELEWLDLRYGPSAHRKLASGAVGDIVLDLPDRRWHEALVWGQYTGIGERVRFGYGRYWIEPLGGSPGVPCPRTTSLLRVFLGSPSDGQGDQLSRHARSSGLAPGVLQAARREVLEEDYSAEPHRRILLGDEGASPRVLALPTRRDRALQRLLLERLAPALDRTFEDSSFAYRKGLGRRDAAKRLKTCVAQGYRHALRADFSKFFDSIDHERLERRLEAVVGDLDLVQLLMEWVRIGSPFRGRGLPTGAPISPVLANLFLDRFDEQVEEQGGRLVRYADDFLVLYKNAARANEIFRETSALARSLCLRLNEEKSENLDLSEPFEFLGYRFEHRDRWRPHGPPGPTTAGELGWIESSRSGKAVALEGLRLPGETGRHSEGHGATILVGDDVQSLKVVDGELCSIGRDAQIHSRIPLGRVHGVALLAQSSLEGSAWKALVEAGVPVVLLAAGGERAAWLTAGDPGDRADALRAQVKVEENDADRLVVATDLVQAKITNYATLARSLDDPELAEQLEAAAKDAENASSLPSLLGIEGSAARAWYGALPTWIPNRFRFPGRVAPDARDPINALLNLGFTMLHRRVGLSLRLTGLEPALGLLHDARRGHDALASDLQEPFRFLVERTVLRFARSARRNEFERTDGSKVYLTSKARRRFVGDVLRDWELESRRGKDALPYSRRIDQQSRALRGFLLGHRPSPGAFRIPIDNSPPRKPRA